MAAVDSEIFSEDSISGQRNHWIRKSNKEKTPALELRKYDLPEEIIEHAVVILKKMDTGVRRARKRDMLFYYCSREAYKTLGIYVDRFELAARFGLKKGDVKKCDTMFSPLNTGFHPVETEVTPMNFIPDFFEKLAIDSAQLPLIENIVARVSKQSPSLLQRNPRTLAAGFIKYFFSISGIHIDNKLLSETTKLSTATIDSMEKKIEDVDNAA